MFLRVRNTHHAQNIGRKTMIYRIRQTIPNRQQGDIEILKDVHIGVS